MIELLTEDLSVQSDSSVSIVGDTPADISFGGFYFRASDGTDLLHLAQFIVPFSKSNSIARVSYAIDEATGRRALGAIKYDTIAQGAGEIFSGANPPPYLALAYPEAGVIEFR